MTSQTHTFKYYTIFYMLLRLTVIFKGRKMNHPYTYFNNRNIRNQGSGDLSRHLKILVTELGNEWHGTDSIGKFCRQQVLKFIVSFIPYNILRFRFARLEILSPNVSTNVSACQQRAEVDTTRKSPFTYTSCQFFYLARVAWQVGRVQIFELNS